MKKYAFLLFLQLTFLLAIHAETAAIFSFDEVEELFDSLDTKSLVVFDVDDVLIQHKDAILHTTNSRAFQSLIVQELPIDDEAFYNQVLTTFYVDAKHMLIEPKIASIIKMLQEKGVQTMALTATKIGAIGNVTSIQDWRINDLQSLGISFSSTFPEIKPFSIQELTEFGPSPIFQEGILFSSLYSKGKTLRYFLETVGKKPEQVIFFDDRVENVLSVDEEMQKLGVENVMSFHYLGAKQKASKYDPLTVEKQRKHLLDYGTWLSDEDIAS